MALQAAVGAPPQAELAMVVGTHRVPMTEVLLTDSDGNWVKKNMVDLGQYGKTKVGQWLWQAVGFSSTEGNHGIRPYNLPLMRELRAAVPGARAKCKRQLSGQYRDQEGRVLPALLDVNLRGRDMSMENNTKRLRINIGDSVEAMNWFLAQLWADTQAEEVMAMGDAVPPSPQRGRKRKKKQVKQAAMTEPQRRVVDTALKTLRTSCKSVHFDHRHGRFRIATIGDKPKYQYLGVRGFRKLLDQDDGDGNPLRERVDITVANFLNDPALKEAMQDQVLAETQLLRLKGQILAESQNLGHEGAMEAHALAPEPVIHEHELLGFFE